MIKYIYSSKNVKSGNFNKPMLEDFGPENAKERYEVTFKETPSGAVEAAKELSLNSTYPPNGLNLPAITSVPVT